MAKPFVYLFTHDGCRPCRCDPARNLLKELMDKNRCDGFEFNLSKLNSNDDPVKYARNRGFRHFPIFLVCHPDKPDPPVEKIWGDTKEKWEKNIARQELEAALDRVWRMR